MKHPARNSEHFRVRNSAPRAYGLQEAFTRFSYTFDAPARAFCLNAILVRQTLCRVFFRSPVGTARHRHTAQQIFAFQTVFSSYPISTRLGTRLFRYPCATGHKRSSSYSDDEYTRSAGVDQLTFGNPIRFVLRQGELR